MCSILHSVKLVFERVEEVSQASQHISVGCEEVSAFMLELEQMAVTTAAHSQQASASSEEQLASISEVASSSEQLEKLASELRIAVKKFTTN